MATGELQRYWTRVAACGCLICRRAAEIAHAHGGSIVERLQEPKDKGKKLLYMDWLVLPLCPDHHRLGPLCLDNDVRLFERTFGRQADMIDLLCAVLRIDVWAKVEEYRCR